MAEVEAHRLRHVLLATLVLPEVVEQIHLPGLPPAVAVGLLAAAELIDDPRVAHVLGVRHVGDAAARTVAVGRVGEERDIGFEAVLAVGPIHQRTVFPLTGGAVVADELVVHQVGGGGGAHVGMHAGVAGEDAEAPVAQAHGGAATVEGHRAGRRARPGGAVAVGHSRIRPLCVHREGDGTARPVGLNTALRALACVLAGAGATCQDECHEERGNGQQHRHRDCGDQLDDVHRLLLVHNIVSFLFHLPLFVMCPIVNPHGNPEHAKQDTT